MSTSRYQWLIPTLATALVLLVIIASWFFWQLAWLTLQVAFADEQTSIFDSMRAQAIATDDPVKAAGFLGYALNYYPSGSKQDVGSRLDEIVERQRTDVIRDIIVDLRKKTGQELGDDPRTWIEKFAPRPTVNSNGDARVP